MEVPFKHLEESTYCAIFVLTTLDSAFTLIKLKIKGSIHKVGTTFPNKQIKLVSFTLSFYFLSAIHFFLVAPHSFRGSAAKYSCVSASIQHLSALILPAT